MTGTIGAMRRSLSVLSLVMGLTVLAACESTPAPDPEPAGPRPIAILIAPDDRAWADGLVVLLPEETVAVRTRPDPIAAIAEVEDEIVIAAVREDGICEDCYRLEPTDGAIVVHGDAPLGLSYGIAHVLEAIGFRFFHPEDTWVPPAIAAPTGLPADVVAPEQAVRGLHLHTLHPIEGYFAVWDPGEENLAAADRIFAWIVANRGNFVHWSALDDLEVVGSRDPWTAHTRTVLEHAHRQGLEVGIGMQLFGEASLQRSFVLIDRSGDVGVQIDEQLALFGDLPFDAMSISFGEFFASDPVAMVTALDRTYEGIQARWPGRRVEAVVHVGAGEELRVTYEGEEMPYYFLAARANPAIVPWIHTVMYYDLFEDAGGAYLHEDFAEHRELLFELLRDERPVAYYPESAYWVAFDNSVPTYLPLYLRTRWTDFDGIRRASEEQGFPALEEHVLFSSGWEWGYWQQDVACLRMGHTLPGTWEEIVRSVVPPWGEAIEAEVAGAIVDATNAQHTALIEQRLAAWVGGRDIALDLGVPRGDISQPVRAEYEALAALSEAERTAFEADVLVPLGALGDAHAAALARLEASGMPAGDPYAEELRDGLAVDVARVRFQEAALRAVLAHAAGADPSEDLVELDARLAEARTIVERRHGTLHTDDPDAILAVRRRTAGLYDFGYLRHADSLCYWDRERTQLRNLIFAETSSEPGCLL